MYVMALGWRVPADCLSRVLGLEAASQSGTTIAPDFSAFIAAAQAAAGKLTESAGALTMFAQSLP
jgi:hypothetical protein